MGSWRRDRDKLIEMSRKVIALYDEFNIYTKYKYSHVINMLRNRKAYQVLWLARRQKEMRKAPYLKAAVFFGPQELLRYLVKAFIIK